MAKNPYFRSGPTELTEAARAHLRTIVIGYLQTNSDQATIPDAVLQALHPQLLITAVWDRVKAELGL